LTDAKASTITVTGNGNFTLTADALNTALTSIDGSTMTGKLVAGTNSTDVAAATIKGGAGADTLTANHASDVLLGGAGNDTLVVNAGLVTLTGGAGNDTFNVGFATSNVNSYASITDLAAGDILKFGAVAANFKAASIILAGTAVFQDYANEAVKTTVTGDVAWFQFGGNTYVVEHASGVTTSFVNGTDVIVQITGLINLSTSSMSSSSDTALIIA
jgi:S-layer protein